MRVRGNRRGERVRERERESLQRFKKYLNNNNGIVWEITVEKEKGKKGKISSYDLLLS